MRRFGIVVFLVSWMAFTAHAEIVYTDLRPDGVVNTNFGKYLIDLNRDGANDFAAWLFLPLRPDEVTVTAFGEHEVLGNKKSGRIIAPVHAAGFAFESPSGNWTKTVSGFSPSYVDDSSSEMDAIGTGYVGVRMLINDHFHYGWVHLHLDVLAGVLTVRDYAMETVPEKAIAAGAKGGFKAKADPVEDLHISHIGDAMNGEGVQFIFRPGLDETRVKEYRLFVLQQEQLPFFGLKEAQSASSEKYIRLKPSGGPLIGNLGAQATDINGESIQTNRAYQAVVLSIAGGDAELDQLSDFSPTLLLRVESTAKSSETWSNVMEKSEQDPAPQDEWLTQDYASESKTYPKIKPKQFRIYSAGKTIVFKCEVSDIDPRSKILVLDPYGQRLAEKFIDGPEVKMPLEGLEEGIYNVRLILNNRLFDNNLYIR